MPWRRRLCGGRRRRCLVAMAVWLTRDTGEHRVYEISSAEGVTGLQSQAAVRYRGVRVGRVLSIALDRTARGGNVLIRIECRPDTPVTLTTFASLGFQGVTGLALSSSTTGVPMGAALQVDEDTPPRIPMRPNLITRLSDQGVGLLKRLDEATQRVNQLLAPHNQQVMVEAVGNAWARPLPASASWRSTPDQALVKQTAELNLPATGPGNVSATLKNHAGRVTERLGTRRPIRHAQIGRGVPCRVPAHE
jgi:phospholipid/cholesterol/gamma-HCH transport system substrate-binding protein